MNPIRKRRLWLLALLLLAAAAAATLITKALQENLTYLHTPTEVKTGKVPAARFRLGGVVCEGSVQRTSGTLAVNFAVTDRVRQVPVHFEKILPDMFKEGTSVIATGRMQGDTFVAEEVLAKHDETYMPKEVADAMAKGIAMHTKSCGAR
ncbi:MAG TPA: cytochrome c maturation protein CcmE [Arenimonas sp.]|uniref:cytochrome c maturation protein CcmE n=1 Tax=Arenimonas sp. TaxID=1872635 RepID=UPI002C12898D|nr:cytochrome c maturation protein CcmE [Arenimonas sp.]HMB56638.1 cytochrome c maturation protein CcmE [Arenimonas sp.]